MATRTEIVIPVSPEQEEIIADHLLNGTELGLLPDERTWMVAQARKKHPNCRVVAADLDMESASWTLTVDF